MRETMVTLLAVALLSKVAAAAPEEKPCVWGVPVNGLQAGLVPLGGDAAKGWGEGDSPFFCPDCANKARKHCMLPSSAAEGRVCAVCGRPRPWSATFAEGEPQVLEFHLRNVGDTNVTLFTLENVSWVLGEFQPDGKWREMVRMGPNWNPGSRGHDAQLSKGMELARDFTHEFFSNDSADAGDANKHRRPPPLRPGRYALAASYEHAEHPQARPCPYWHGKVMTGTVEIEIKPKVVWGDTAAGLQVALEVEPPAWRPGEKVMLRLYAKNVSDGPLRVLNWSAQDRCLSRLAMGDGKEIAMGGGNDASPALGSNDYVTIPAGKTQTFTLAGIFDQGRFLVRTLKGGGVQHWPNMAGERLAAGRYELTAMLSGHRGRDETDWQGPKAESRPFGIVIVVTNALAVQPLAAPASAGTQVVGASVAPFFAKCRNADDRVTTEGREGRVVLTVASPRGIGQAEVKPGTGQWPKQVTVRLALKGLESFTAGNGRERRSASLGQVGPDSPALAVRAEDGRVLVELPDNFLAGSDTLTLEWIDFFRR